MAKSNRNKYGDKPDWFPIPSGNHQPRTKYGDKKDHKPRATTREQHRYAPTQDKTYQRSLIYDAGMWDVGTAKAAKRRQKHANVYLEGQTKIK